MLTVLNVLPDGHEDIVEVTRASFGKTPNPNPQTSDDQFIDVVWGEIDHQHTIPFERGTVYVMNAHGRTVAKYELTAPHASSNYP